MIIEEQYHAQVIPVDTTVQLEGRGIGGFIAVTAGTLTVTYRDGSVALAAFPVAAGTSYKLPIYTGTNGYSVTTGGGASGTLLKV